MSPAVYLEVLQTRRGVWKMMLLVLVAAFGLRVVLGELGGLLALLVLLPQSAGGIGLGSFLEELASGQMRFLYALPLRRTTLWWVKLTSGLLGAAAMAATVFAGIALGRLVRPAEMGFGLVFQLLDIGPGSLLLALGGYSLYTYAGGLFAILVSRQPKLAQLLNLLLGYAPLGLVAVLTVVTGIPSLAAIVAGLAGAAVVLGLGSWLLYARRNPFDESIRLAAPGAATLLAAALVFSVTTAAVARLAPGTVRPRADRVVAFFPAPDGDAVLAIVGGLAGTRGYLLDADGRITADLGPDVVFAGLQPVWDHGHLLVQRRPGLGVMAGLTGDFETDGATLLVVDRESGALRELPTPGEDASATTGPAGMTWVLGWTDDRGSIVSARVDWGDGEGRRRLFVQDAATGAAREVDAGGDDGGTVPRLLGGGTLAWDDGAPTGAPTTVSLQDVATGHDASVALPPGTVAWVPAADGRRLLVLQRVVDDTVITFRLVALDRTTGEERVVLAAPNLPSATLAEAARNELPPVQLQELRHTSWAVCAAPATDGAVGRAWLVSADGGDVAALDPDLGTDDARAFLVPSPSGRRFLAIRQEWDSADATPQTPVRVLARHEGALRAEAEHQVAGSGVEWLGEERLLFLRNAGNDDVFGGNELWLLDLRDGTERRFFDAEWAPPPGLEGAGG